MMVNKTKHSRTKEEPASREHEQSQNTRDTWRNILPNKEFAEGIQLTLEEAWH